MAHAPKHSMAAPSQSASSPPSCNRKGETYVKKLKVATLTSAATPAASSRGGCKMARRLSRADAAAASWRAAGMAKRKPAPPHRASTPMAANTQRHDETAPSHVPSGTPPASARVRPSQTMDSALPARRGSTRLVAACDATAMNTPCARPTTKRTPSSAPSAGACAMATLPAASTSMVATSIWRVGRRASMAVSTGAPMTAPSAYAAMAPPAAATLACKSRAIGVNRPAAMNSHKPKAKLHKDSQ